MKYIGRFILLLFLVIMAFKPVLVNANIIPKNAKIHNSLGNDYCDKGEFEKAVEEYEKSAKIYPNYTDALYNLGFTYYMDLKNYVKAAYFMKRFLQLEGNESADAKQIKKWLDDAEQKVSAMKIKAPQEKKSSVPKQKEKIDTKVIPQPIQKKVAKAREPTPQPKPLPPIKKKVEGKKTVAPSLSPKEQAIKYKGKGNKYNSVGNPQEAVKYYRKALKLYPGYTDALYNIAKTYDFDLKDHPKAIEYYKQFLKFESPTSRDAAQVKIWLGRVENSYRQKKEKPLQPTTKVAALPKSTRTSKSPTRTSKSPTRTSKSPTRASKAPKGNERVADYISKGMLSLTTQEEENTEDKEKLSALKKPASRKEEREGTKQRVLKQREEISLPRLKPEIKKPVKKPTQVVKATPSPPPVKPKIPDRQIVLEMVTPKNLLGSKWVTLGLRQMQREILELLAQNKAKTPQKLAEIFSSKIQSEILPSGEKLSYFKLDEEDIADLPYITVLTDQEKRDLEKEKWDLIRTRKSPARLREVLMVLRNGYQVVK